MMTCWIVRIWSALGREPSAGPRLMRRHLKACGRCCRRVALERQLAVALTAQAKTVRVVAPPFLARRIVGALDRASSPTPWPGAWKPIVAALALASVAILAWRLTTPDASPRTAAEIPSVARPRPAESVEAASVLSLPLVDALPGRDRLLELSPMLGQPLEAELDAVVQDSLRAVQYLAGSFLPEGAQP